VTNILDPGKSEISEAKARQCAERLETHVRALSETIGERNVYRPLALSDAADYIERQWLAMGYEVVRQTYELDGILCSNLEIVRLGIRHPEEILLIGAHYDTVIGSPGANDNGSGVAAMLEMARQFADVEVDRTVRFVAFVNEEQPFKSAGARTSSARRRWRCRAGTAIARACYRFVRMSRTRLPVMGFSTGSTCRLTSMHKRRIAVPRY
jgi:acetylornithine deacetylase/succinyl-diaminopimelate desuccinylase-like protein